jgi:endoglucanase
VPVRATAAAGLLLIACASVVVRSAEQPGSVRVNQLGFLPHAHKLALVESPVAREFSVIRADNERVVLRGMLQPAQVWAPAGRMAAVADFTRLAQAGSYRLVVEGLPSSDPFVVDANAYSGLADAALKAFYFNRAGMALDARHAGAHARAAGHPDVEVEVHASAASALRPAGTVIAAPGGWYDAGDYNKYVVNSGITTYTLLAALEHFPEIFSRARRGHSGKRRCRARHPR